MYKLFKGDHCGEKDSSTIYYFHVETVLIISTKLAGNSIGKFRLSVENSKNGILQILQTRLDLECSVKHSTDTCRCPIKCQTAKPKIKHPWWSEFFTCKMFLEVID